MFLGNIISEQPVKQNGLFFITNNLENVNREIPTLVIGWDFSKRIFNGSKLSILDKKIDKNISWTFTKKEKRVDYEKDLKFFMKNSLLSAENRFKYQYVNALTEKYETFKIKDDKKVDLKFHFDNATIVNIKNGCIFSINGLNKLIELEADCEQGNINYKNHKIDWESHKNTLILSNKNKLLIKGIKKIENIVEKV